MKSTLIAFSALLALSYVSCKDDKKETVSYIKDTTAVTASGDAAKPVFTAGKAVSVTADRVPQPVTASFKTKYPKVLTPQWIEYTPVESDELPMDNTYYYVQFDDNGNDMTAWYNALGDWVKTSTVIPGDSRLPDPVNKTINAMYPGYKIEEVKKENDKNMEMYKIKMNKGDDKVKLKILPNGEIFKIK